jgi:hypothetical protein
MRDLDEARAHLESPGVPALGADDRKLLADTFDRVKAEVEILAPPQTYTVLHGSPHSYNVLLVAGAPCFIDLETVCTGPAEWDRAHVEHEGGEQSSGGTAAARLRQACRDMARVVAAIWCWSDVEKGDLRVHAQLHLDHIREMAAVRADR